MATNDDISLMRIGEIPDSGATDDPWTHIKAFKDSPIDTFMIECFSSTDGKTLTVWIKQGKVEGLCFHSHKFSRYFIKLLPDGGGLRCVRVCLAQRPDLILIDASEASSVLCNYDEGSWSSCSCAASFDHVYHYDACTEYTKKYRILAKIYEFLAASLKVKNKSTTSTGQYNCKPEKETTIEKKLFYNLEDFTTVSARFSTQMFRIKGRPRIREIIDTNYRCNIPAPFLSVIRRKPLLKWPYHGHRQNVPCYLVAWCCNYKDPPAGFSSSEVHSLIYSKRIIIVRGGGDSESHASSSEAISGFSDIESSLESDREFWDGIFKNCEQNVEAGPSNYVNTSKSDSYNMNAQIGPITNTDALVDDITKFLNGSNGSLLIVSEHDESRSHDIDKPVGSAIGYMQIPRLNGFSLILPPASAPPPLTDGQEQPPAQIYESVSTDFLKNPNGQYICPHNLCPPGVFSFQTKRQYILHLDVHHKIKFYACGTCDAQFNRKDNCTKHLKDYGHVLGQEGGIDWDAENMFIHNVQSIPVLPAAISPFATPQRGPPKIAMTTQVQRTYPPRSSNRAPPSGTVTNPSAEDSNPANITTSTKDSQAVPRTINPVSEGSGNLGNDSSAAEVADLKKQLEESKLEIRRLNRLVDRFLDNEDENMGNARKKRRLLDNTVEDQ